MTELNGEYLRNSIQNLPIHKAGDFVWEEIRWQLEQPLVAELPLHEAPESAWEGLLASGVVSKRTEFIRLSLIAGMMLLMITLALYPVQLSEMKAEPEQNIQNNLFSITPSEKEITAKKENPAVTIDSPDKSADFIKNNPALSKHVAFIPVSSWDSTDYTNPENHINHSLHLPVTAKIVFDESIVQSDMHLRDKGKINDCSSFHEVNTSVFLQADFTPEFFTNKAINSPVYNFSLSTGYRHNRLSMTLGAGYTRIKSSSDMSYDYRTNELVYSYDYVDSVYVDPVTHETYYYTVNVDVYDSIDHSAAERLTDRYSFLQIPVSVSYELADYKNLSFHIQLNGTYHLLKDDFRNYKPFFEPSSRLTFNKHGKQKINKRLLECRSRDNDQLQDRGKSRH